MTIPMRARGKRERRIRISGFFACSILVLGLAAQPAPEWSTDAHDYRIHMIGQAHIDPVWLWPWPEGLSVVHSTFRSALDRMKETSGFAFTASSAQFYKWVSENDPAMLAEIRKRVEEGRWGLVGGWWVEPDVNIPSGESLVRQGLYGQLTLRHLLGRTARVAYNPDSFGHTGTLPQILKLEGMNDYVFMRPQPNEKTLPANLFWWSAPDGSRVLAYRIPISYNDDASVRKRVTDVLAHYPDPAKDLMVFYGVGDHGGGATKENIRSIEEIRSEPAAPTLIYSTPERYFAEIRESHLAGLPVYTGDLQHHSVGCYTAESAVKKLNRTTEIALQTAEKIASIGALVWGANYPARDFETAWERVLFLQFHDSLAGTALPEHYQHAMPDGYHYALDIASHAMYQAAQKLAWQIPAIDPDSDYLVAFNPHAWPVAANLEYDLAWRTGLPGSLKDERGKPMGFQWAPPTTEVNGRRRLIARVDLPALGYRQIRIRRTPGPKIEPGVRASEHGLENQHLAVTFGPDGTIGLFDKDNHKQIFTDGQAGARGLVMDDPSDTWSHGVRAYDKQVGAFGHATVRVLENGPVRASVRVESHWGQSAMTADWLLYSDSRTVEARVTLDWHEQRKMLKLSFPVDVAAPRPTYEIAYGTIVRDTSGDEEPGQRWLDLTASDNAYGLAVINDAKYGYSVSGSDMRISVVRGAPFAHHDPHVLDPNADHEWQDQGRQTFRLLLAPHRGSWQEAGLPRMAEEFTTPVPIIYQGIHPGSRPATDSFLSVDASNIIVSVVKKQEQGDDLIIRCYETAGRATSASIDLRFAKRRWTGQFRPSEIKTLRFTPSTGEFREVSALEE